MKVRLVDLETLRTIAEHTLIDLTFDFAGSYFYLEGGALRVALRDVALPAEASSHTGGMTLRFRSTDEATRFSAELVNALQHAAELSSRMLD